MTIDSILNLEATLASAIACKTEVSVRVLAFLGTKLQLFLNLRRYVWKYNSRLETQISAVKVSFHPLGKKSTLLNFHEQVVFEK